MCLFLDRETETQKSYGTRALTLKVAPGARDLLLNTDLDNGACASPAFPNCKWHGLQSPVLTHEGTVKYSLYLPDADTLPFLTMVSPQLMCPALN